MKKTEVVQKVVGLMCTYGVSMSDIEAGLKMMPVKITFDLAVKEDDDCIVRIPFATNSVIARDKIAGIYPFKDCDYYLCLEEDAYMHGFKAERHQLPKEGYMRRLAEIREPLNKALIELGAKPLEGIYFSRPDETDNLLDYMVVRFADDKPYDAWKVDKAQPAKVRYVVKP